jgi:hypothetical protein
MSEVYHLPLFRPSKRPAWSRNMLTMMIDVAKHRRQGQAVTNFEQFLRSPQSDLAQQTLPGPFSSRP